MEVAGVGTVGQDARAQTAIIELGGTQIAAEAIVPMRAGFVVGEGRVYLRSTRFEQMTFERLSGFGWFGYDKFPNDAYQDGFLRPLKWTGRLAYDSIDPAEDIPAAGIQIAVEMKHRTIATATVTMHTVTDANGRFEVEIREQTQLVPGPNTAAANYDINVTTEGTDTTVWPATWTMPYTMHPAQLVAFPNHELGSPGSGAGHHAMNVREDAHHNYHVDDYGYQETWTNPTTHARHTSEPWVSLGIRADAVTIEALDNVDLLGQIKVRIKDALIQEGGADERALRTNAATQARIVPLSKSIAAAPGWFSLTPATLLAMPIFTQAVQQLGEVWVKVAWEQLPAAQAMWKKANADHWSLVLLEQIQDDPRTDLNRWIGGSPTAAGNNTFVRGGWGASFNPFAFKVIKQPTYHWKKGTRHHTTAQIRAMKLPPKPSHPSAGDKYASGGYVYTWAKVTAPAAPALHVKAHQVHHVVKRNKTVGVVGFTTYVTSRSTARPDSTARTLGYFGRYSATWGTQTTTVHLAAPHIPSGAKITGATLTFQLSHTWLGSGHPGVRVHFQPSSSGGRHIVTGQGPASNVVNNGQKGTVTFSAAQAKTLAAGRYLIVNASNASQQSYGNIVGGSVKVTFHYSV